MPFHTSATRQKGYYGKLVNDYKSGTTKFQALGKEIRLIGITENIETESVTWTLAFAFGGNVKTVEIPRKCIADYRTLLPELAKQGADVAPKNASIILDTLRLQQERLEKRARCSIRMNALDGSSPLTSRTTATVGMTSKETAVSAPPIPARTWLNQPGYSLTGSKVS